MPWIQRLLGYSDALIRYTSSFRALSPSSGWGPQKVPLWSRYGPEVTPVPTATSGARESDLPGGNSTKLTLEKASSEQVEVLDPESRLIAHLLRAEWRPLIEKKLSSSVWSYRKGRSLEEAIVLVQEGLRTSSWQIAHEVSNFFGSVNTSALLERLSLLATKTLRKTLPLVSQIAKAEFGGLAPSCGLVKDLSNLALTPLDTFLEEKKIPFLRFCDDLLIFCKRQSQAQHLYSEISTLLSSLDFSSIGQNRGSSARAKNFPSSDGNSPVRISAPARKASLDWKRRFR